MTGPPLLEFLKTYSAAVVSVEALDQELPLPVREVHALLLAELAEFLEIEFARPVQVGLLEALVQVLQSDFRLQLLELVTGTHVDVEIQFFYWSISDAYYLSVLPVYSHAGIYYFLGRPVDISVFELVSPAESRGS